MRSQKEDILNPHHPTGHPKMLYFLRLNQNKKSLPARQWDQGKHTWELSSLSLKGEKRKSGHMPHTTSTSRWQIWFWIYLTLLSSECEVHGRAAVMKREQERKQRRKSREQEEEWGRGSWTPSKRNSVEMWRKNAMQSIHLPSVRPSMSPPQSRNISTVNQEVS